VSPVNYSTLACLANIGQEGLLISAHLSGVPAKVHYKRIAEVLGSEFRNMDAENVRILLEQSDIDAEDLETFLSGMSSLGRRIGNALPQILPAAAPIIGGAIGGPAGAAVGQVVGNVAGTALRSGRPATASSSQAPARPAALQSAPVPSPFPAQQPSMAGGSPAASQLIQLLYRPELLQSLMAMVMGQAGSPSVRVGSNQVPPSALTNLVAQLANQATAEYNALENVIRPHREWVDVAGEKIDDTAESAARAARLLRELQEVDLEEGLYPVRFSRNRAFEEEDEDSYDELLMAELYADLDNWG